MARDRDPRHPLLLDDVVESEHRAGTDLAWIVVVGTVLCALAIAFAVPDALLDRVADRSGLNTNGLIALITVVPLGATVFATRRYRDAVAAQRELAHLSLHDGLTGLPNRRHLRLVLPEAFHLARRHNTKAAVLFIDLDGFKAVNDTYGHEIGDKLMVAVAERLGREADDDRWVARYAGDEFVMIDPTPHTPEHARSFAEHLISVLENPFELGADRIAISASVGVAFGDVTDDPDDVLHDADIAMYDAKHTEGQTAMFSTAMRARLTPATAQQRLEDALAGRQFRLLYQPIVALRTRRMVGCEALLRWDDPERGMVPPGDFLGALEETGLIVPVGRWVLEEACRQSARWSEMTPDGQPPLRVTVNVSPRQIGQTDFADDVRHALETSGADPSAFFLEITEAALLADPRAAWSAMSAVRELGVGVALDDFGTGYSALNHLRNFDLALVKLDETYVAALGRREADEAIVRHVASLARALGMATVAEGVHDEAQVTRLLDMGCELGQGHFFSPPRPPTIIDSILDVGLAAGRVPVAAVEEHPVDEAPVAVALPRLQASVVPAGR